MKTDLKQQLNDFFDRLEERSGQSPFLNVKWDTGGDETPVYFEVDGKYIHYCENKFLDALAGHLIQKFDLPNAGEYYNVGKAEIYRKESNELWIKYDEFAYTYSEEERIIADSGTEGIFIPDKDHAPVLLSLLQNNERDIYGDIRYAREKSRYMSIGGDDRFDPEKERLKNKIIDIIEVVLIGRIGRHITCGEVVFNGELQERGILLESAIWSLYEIDKDHQNQDELLFDPKQKGGWSTFFRS